VARKLTTSVSDATLEALDAAIAAGRAPNRSAALAEALELWLAAGREAQITESYRRRYLEPPPEAANADEVADVMRALEQ
jgi:Arc/MetJ-type ribon-helix-helix transcriptional regulator